MTTSDIHRMTLSQLKRNLEAKNLSSREITESFLKRISETNKSLNAFITITEEQAVSESVEADEIIANGKAKSLTGLPFAHKDLFCTDGILTTCASKMLSNFVPPYDATVVKRLKDAGIIMIGKTNMDEFAMGSSNETSYYGNVSNPWNLDLSPGGSSGGSAAAVAAGLAPAATGTDTGGSIRQPAALTGVTGIKPTYGRVSRYGMIAFASSLDQGGFFTKSSEDAALLLTEVAGLDEFDSTSSAEPVPDYTASINNSIKDIKIGLIKQHFEEGLDETNKKVLGEALKALESQGAEIIEIDMPNIGLSVPTYYVVASAECSSNLSRYDGIRFGHRAENFNDLTDFYSKTRGEGFGSEVKRRIMTGTYVLSAGYYDAYYLKAQKVRQLISEDFKNAFEKVNVIAGPTTPSPAFPLGAKMDDPIEMYLNDIFTIGANLAGLPAMSIPCGFVNNLPIGLQLIGKHFGEESILQCGHQYQQITDWHQQVPEDFK
jgi:aspartyl-tRNA(Asn)/glutamyl-tRNA(Gln) amidotransferase subunit A